MTVADGRLVLRNANAARVLLTERGTVTYHVDPDAGPEVDAGVYWHLRDPDGKLVVIHAGRVVWDLETFEPSSWTPNQEPSFSGVICPALGGAPA